MHTLFVIVAPIFALILVGYLCRRANKLGDKAAAQATWASIKGNNGAAVLAQNWTLISNK